MVSGEGPFHPAELGGRRPRPEGGLYRRSAFTYPETHAAVSRDLASAATLAMWERKVSLQYPSGASSPGALPAAPAFAYLSATSLPLAPLCAATHRVVTSLSLPRAREQTSMLRRRSAGWGQGHRSSLGPPC